MSEWRGLGRTWRTARWSAAVWLLVLPASAQPSVTEFPDESDDTASANAQPPGPPSDPDEVRRPAYEDEALPEQPKATAQERRETPDYDGRQPKRSGAKGMATMVPRVVLSPLYFVSEFLIRRPLGYVVTQVEKHDIPVRVVEALTFGPNRRAGIVPTALIDFGFRPSIGAFLFVKDALIEDNRLRLGGAWGGHDWRSLALRDYYEPNEEQRVGVRLAYLARPDWVFHGIGPNSGKRRARYSETRLSAELDYRLRLWRSSGLDAGVLVQDSEFEPGEGCCDDPDVAEEVAAGRFPLPEGMSRGFTTLQSHLQLAVDTRSRRRLQQDREGSDFVQPPGSGVRFAGRFSHGGGLRTNSRASVGEPSRYSWVRYGGTLGGFVDVNDQQRVLGLQVVVDFAEPLHENGTIPFSQLVDLGGERPMRGYLEGRLRDRSAVVAQLEYQWPIWVWLDGKMQYEVGNVFGTQLEGFAFELLRQSFGIGLSTNHVREHAFEVLVGAGTRTFEEGSEIEHLRFVFGATSGF